jgi:hypothetical protein
VPYFLFFSFLFLNACLFSFHERLLTTYRPTRRSRPDGGVRLQLGPGVHQDIHVGGHEAYRHHAGSVREFSGICEPHPFFTSFTFVVY